MKKIFICLVLIVSIFIITGCGKEDSKNTSFQKMSFDALKGIKTTKTDSGTLDTGEKWQSVRYVTDNMILSIICYEDRDMNGGINLKAGYKDKKISGIKYKYNEMTVKDDRVFAQYYTQVDKDTYYISVTREKNDKSKEKLDKFMKSIKIEK